MTMDGKNPDDLDTRDVLARAWKLEKLSRPIAAGWDRLADIAQEVREADAFRVAWVKQQRSQRGEWQ